MLVFTPWYASDIQQQIRSKQEEDLYYTILRLSSSQLRDFITRHTARPPIDAERERFILKCCLYRQNQLLSESSQDNVAQPQKNKLVDFMVNYTASSLLYRSIFGVLSGYDDKK
jgi:homoserine kinase